LKATVASGLSPSPVHIRHLCPLIALAPQYANLKKAPADGLQIHNVTDLAQNRYFDDEAFVGYLKYLLYWKQPEYAKFIVYPHAFFFLDLLQSAHFRAAMAHPANKEVAHRQQFYFWKHYRNNRLKHILPRPMPKDPAPPPPMPPPASTPVLPPVPVKPEGTTRAGAGERRKRKYAN
jgi:hypothetical protein